MVCVCACVFVCLYVCGSDVCDNAFSLTQRMCCFARGTGRIGRACAFYTRTRFQHKHMRSGMPKRITHFPPPSRAPVASRSFEAVLPPAGPATPSNNRGTQMSSSPPQSNKSSPVRGKDTSSHSRMAMVLASCTGGRIGQFCKVPVNRVQIQASAVCEGRRAQ